MTWVLAKPFVQDYALVISDVCVTVKDPESGGRSYADCLLKIHVISEQNGLLVGFSGSVRNAFLVIDDMRKVASRMVGESSDGKIDVIDFIKEWREYTKQKNAHLYPDAGDEAVHMFVAGNHTSQNSGGDRHPYSSVYMIRSPEYRPMSVHPHQWSHIGSGSDMKVCQDIVEQLSKDVRARLAAIDVTPQQFVDFLVPKISTILEQELRESGVSKQLSIGISTPGSTGIAFTYRKDEDSNEPWKKLATTFDELVRKIDSPSAQARILAK